jgi:6-phosphogluconate dehydrogenase
LKTLAPKDGYLYCGPVGAGHFVKMVHNGIEYGLMAAYGEGFQILHASPYNEGLSLEKVAHLWNRGSVVRSWLLELVEDAFKKDEDLSGVKGFVEDSGEGRWTVEQAIELGVPAPVTAIALFERFRSRETESFSDKLQAALRNEFGGHAVLREKEKAAAVSTQKTVRTRGRAR